MRLAVYIGATLALWFVAGAYRVMPLMALALAMALLLGVLLALSQLEAALLGVVIEARQRQVERGSQASFTLRATNRCLLPVSSFDIHLELCYRDGQIPATPLVIGGVVSGRSQVDVPVLVEAPHCGVLLVRVTRIVARDPLGLFGARRSPRTAQASVPVVPAGTRSATVRPGSGTSASGVQEALAAVARVGSLPPDVEHVRAYRPGDALHAIHWKLSARSLDTFVKEYPAENGIDALVLCDLGVRAGATATPDDFDALADALRQLMHGLAQAGLSHALLWMGASGTAPQTVLVRDAGDVGEALRSLVIGAMPYEVGAGDEHAAQGALSVETDDGPAGQASPASNGIAANATGRQDLAAPWARAATLLQTPADAISQAGLEPPAGETEETFGTSLRLRLDLDLNLFLGTRLIASFGPGGIR